MAQPAAGAVLGNEASIARDQRRAELRTALQASRRSHHLLPVHAETPQTRDRHLTESERAEMRRQLRQQQQQQQQQQGEGAKGRP